MADHPSCALFSREAGSGPAVFCFHSNASHGGQWRDLMERLAGHFRAIAIDSYGAGKSCEWPSATQITLADEVAAAQPLLDAAQEPLHLVGHSYGAAVALKAALAQPDRIGSLVLYEPTCFWLVDQVQPRPNGTDGIRDAVTRASQCLDRGDTEGAGRVFIDYWMGAGSFDGMPPERRATVAASCANVRRWAHALLAETTPLHAFAALDMPILYITGEKSPEAAKAVARVLLPLLPNARHLQLPGLGHMGPVTHAPMVGKAMQEFLEPMR